MDPLPPGRWINWSPCPYGKGSTVFCRAEACDPRKTTGAAAKLTATKSSLFGFGRDWRGDVSVPPGLLDSALSVTRSGTRERQRNEPLVQSRYPRQLRQQRTYPPPGMSNPAAVHGGRQMWALDLVPERNGRAGRFAPADPLTPSQAVPAIPSTSSTSRSPGSHVQTAAVHARRYPVRTRCRAHAFGPVKCAVHPD